MKRFGLVAVCWLMLSGYYGVGEGVVGCTALYVKSMEANAKYKKQQRHLMLAEQGDEEAQFKSSFFADTPEDRWRWLCLSAHQGYAPAQFELAEKYKKYLGRGTHAYVWYSLAAQNGMDVAAWKRSISARSMTADEIAEAERLVSQWHPDPQSCNATEA